MGSSFNNHQSEDNAHQSEAFTPAPGLEQATQTSTGAASHTQAQKPAKHPKKKKK